MRIGILGSGDVGRRLGDGLIELGHSIKIGCRDPNKKDIVQWVTNHGGEEGKGSPGAPVRIVHARGEAPGGYLSR